MKVITDSVRLNEETVGERFEKEVLARRVSHLAVLFALTDPRCRYPPVFHEWFLETFPEPSAWLRARLAYSRTNAVMCIVGFVLGCVPSSRRGSQLILGADSEIGTARTFWSTRRTATRFMSTSTASSTRYVRREDAGQDADENVFRARLSTSGSAFRSASRTTLSTGWESWE